MWSWCSIHRKPNMTRIQKSILIILLILGFGLIAVESQLEKTILANGGTIPGRDLRFSHDSGFYAENIEIALHDDAAEYIYYTVDGSIPSCENNNAILYTNRILLESEELENVYCVKAVSYYEDGSTSEVICRTYIIGQNIEERYDLLVLSVSGDPYDFYNYETGIMVHGKKDEAYIAAHPEWAEHFRYNSIPVFGNFYQTGRESEKLVNATLFDSTGKVLFSQNAGFRIYGAVSRMKNQPSFRLYARSEYDEKNEFDYALFDSQYSKEQKTLIDKYKRLIVRNAGNDNGYAFIRSELTSRIAIDFGFPDAQSARAVCVYLNGEYYGVHWFVANFDDEYFKQTYGEYTGEMYIMEGSMNSLTVSEDETDQIYIDLVEEYNESYKKYANCDLNETKNWEALNAFMDVDNFLQYLAIQHYTGNWDSLMNNYRIYRYYAKDGSYEEGTVFDGKYRFLLFDMDYSLGLEQIYSFLESEQQLLTKDRMESSEEYCYFFQNLMTRQDCRETYVRYYLACMNYYYSASYVEPILENMHGSRAKELQYVYNNTNLLENNFYAPLNVGGENVEVEVQRIRSFCIKRPQYALDDIYQAFGEFHTYTLNVKNDSEAVVWVDSAEVTAQEFSGIYMLDIPTVLRAQAKVGERFSHWLINGERIDEETVEIKDYMVQDHVVNVTCVCVSDDATGIRISAVKSKGKNDYINLTNFGQSPVSLGNYYLTDGVSCSNLPILTLEKQESIIIYCSNNVVIEALGAPGVNFNISTGELISLCDKNGVSVSQVKVPELGSENGVYELDIQRNVFREVLR